METLIEQGRAKPYEEAVDLMLVLKDLAEFEERLDAFEVRLTRVLEPYGRRQALIRRLRQVGLIS